MKKKFHKSHHDSHSSAQIKLSGTERHGLLVTLYGANADVEDESGMIHRCYIRKNIDSLVVGDQVLWQPDTATIVNHLPRKSLLARPENSKKIKPVAANIDTIIIVTTPPPILSEHLIDRYLVAAEHLHIQPAILLNKMDLLASTTRDEIKKRLAIYEKIGYSILYSSTLTKDGLESLQTFLKNKNSVLVGASGVGKSSIIAALTQQSDIKIGAVSNKGVGKHTTTTARLYHLPTGGTLIDSPGVREFGLWNMDKQAVLVGFKEFHDFLNACKFSDCSHIKEPACAIQKAIAENKISRQRFESYLEIINELN